MGNVRLHTSSTQQVTCVSNAFIDEYMKDANGEYVKIYLYLLRCLGQERAGLSVSSMADALDHTEKDVRRALKYWEKLNLLHLEYDNNDELTGICLISASEDFSASPGSVTPTSLQMGGMPLPQAGSLTISPEDKPFISGNGDSPAGGHSPKVQNTASLGNSRQPDRPMYSADQMKVFKENDDIKELLFITQTYLGRTLSMNDTNAILYWYDSMGFSADLIEYLVEYCVEKGHTNIRYMEKVAMGWADSNIHTVDEAKKAASIHSQAYYAVMKAFGISGRNLIETETNYIEKWTNEFGFTLDIITEACKRTILSIQKPNFEYADTILTSWHNASIHHLEDIAKMDTAFANAKKTANNNKPMVSSNNRFHNFSQRDYDYEALENKLLQQ